MFQIELTDAARTDLREFRKMDQTMLIEAIETQLRFEPDVPTTNRKRLRTNPYVEWELRVGDFRVFYDLDAASRQVVVKAIGRKDRSQLSIGGEEFKL